MARDPIGNAIRNLFALQRIGNGMSADAQKLIRALFDDLAGQLARIDPSAPGAARYRRARIEKVMGTVEQLTGETFTELRKELRGKLAALGASQSKFASTQLELALTNPIGRVAIDIRPGRMGANLMKSIIDTDPIHGYTLQQWFEGQKRGTIGRVRRQIQLGMAQNETTDDIIRRVRGKSNGRGGFVGGVMDTTSREAEAIVRTSVTHIANVAHFETYKQNADILSGYEYTATLDSRTTLICAALDGQVFAIEDQTAPKPPQHPNCRSSITPVIDWEGLGVEPPDEGTRASEDGPVKASTTYQDWLTRQPVELQNEILGPARAQLFRQGKVTLKDLVRGDSTIVRLDQLPSPAPPPAAVPAPRPRPRKLAELVDAVDRSIRELPTEVAHAFDAAGNVVLVKGQGKVSEVSFTPAEVAMMKDTIMTHNHPRSSSFSPEDIMFLVENDLQEIRAVGRAFRYRMVRPPEGWSPGLAKRIMRLFPKVEREVLDDM